MLDLPSSHCMKTDFEVLSLLLQVASKDPSLLPERSFLPSLPSLRRMHLPYSPLDFVLLLILISLIKATINLTATMCHKQC